MLYLKSVRNSVLARYNPFTDKIKKVDKGTNFGIQPRNAEQSFAFEVLNDPNIKLVGLTGKAGTGKTLLALASALKQAGTYKQILLARPIVAWRIRISVSFRVTRSKGRSLYATSIR